MIELDGEDVLVHVKAVPCASRDEIVGTVGGRLKVRVSAPPEGGRANKAIRKLIAEAVGVRPNQVSIDSGPTNAHKTVRVAGCTLQAASDRLG